MKATLLCSKPNCTHNNEDCNAVIGVVDNICYYQNSIYYVCEAGPEKENIGYYLTRLSADGTAKENLLYIADDLTDWVIHRGSFYYSIRRFHVDKNSGLEDIDKTDCYVYSYSINGKSTEPKELYFAKEIEKYAQITSLMAYGDNLYFELYGMNRNNNKEEVYKTVRLNIHDNSTSYMKTTDGYILTRPIYLDGKLIFTSISGDDWLYKTDFNGNNPEKFFKLENRDIVSSDGKYLYIDNYVSVIRPNEENNNDQSRFIKVYDSGLNKVDEFSLGNGSAKTWSLLPVDDKYFIIAGKNDNGDLIFYYDKSEFGTLNGKEWEKKFSVK